MADRDFMDCRPRIGNLLGAFSCVFCLHVERGIPTTPYSIWIWPTCQGCYQIALALVLFGIA